MADIHHASFKPDLPDKAIAIVGMGMRFPSTVENEEDLWQTLANSLCNISTVPDSRWPASDMQHPKRGEPGRSVSFAAGILKDATLFDATFFNISPREASWLDPQQRLLLELAHEAMEDAGIPPYRLRGANCGVYIGISGMDYGQNALDDLASMSAHTMTGNTLSISANRLSWFYDLRGPSMAIDTACSSALAAVHQACQAILRGEVDVALTGGVNMLMHPYPFIGFSHASMLSAAGKCRPFDARGDGYVRGEGGAVLLLKNLGKALADGDHIHALILASGVNSDGARKKGLTIPSAEAQAELMKQVLQKSGLQPDDIDYVEAHGTGTPVGDPVEARSIDEAYGKRRSAPLPISSSKANFGHLEPASGMAALIKSILALKHAFIPPMPFDFQPNPDIGFENLNVVCAASGQQLPEKPGPRIGAVNAFGFGGLNAHLIIGLPPEELKEPAPENRPQDLPPLFISARNDAALRSLAARYAELLKQHPDTELYDLAWNAAFHRDFMEKRLAINGRDREDWIKSLEEFAKGKLAPMSILEKALPDTPRVAFVYSGNGAQWHGMGRQLYDESPLFASFIDELDQKMRPLLGWSVREAIFSENPEKLDDTAIAQPLLFAIQVTLTRLLAHFGIKPAGCAGHSVGEVAAAWAAGALNLEEAIQVIHARSAVQGQTRGCGRMAVVGLGPEEAARLIGQLNLKDRVEIAAINTPGNCTLTGDGEGIAAIGKTLQSEHVFFRMLNLDYAFHSCQMDRVQPDLTRLLENLAPAHETNTDFVSTVHGMPREPEKLDAAYWWANMRMPVDFAAAISSLAEKGANIFVEIGPNAILQRYIRENLPAGSACRILPGLQANNAGMERVRELVASAQLLLAPRALAALFPRPGNWVKLPLYPWQKSEHIYKHTSEGWPQQRRASPLLGWSLPAPQPAWEIVLDPRKDPWLADHVIDGSIVFPAAAYIEMCLQAASSWLDTTTFALENFDILLPMVFDASSAQTVRCFIDPEDSSISILSRPRLEHGHWLLHARCRAVTTARAALAESSINVPDASAVINASELYAKCAGLGLEYGPFFSRISQLRHGENSLEADLRLVDSSSFLLDPGALDACFHSLVALYGVQLPDAAFLPTGFGKLKLLGKGQAASIRGRVERSGKRSLHASFEILDKNGKQLARISDASFRKLPVARATSETSTWLVKKKFQPLPIAEALPQNLPTFSALAEKLQKTQGVLKMDRRLWHEEILPRLEAITILVLQELKGRDEAFFSRLPEDFRAWLDTLPNFAIAENLPDWRQIWHEAYALQPAFLPALLPLGRILRLLADQEPSLNSELGGCLSGEDIAVINSADNPAYSGVDAMLEKLMAEWLRHWPAGRQLKILEIASYNAKKSLSETLVPADHLQHERILLDRPFQSTRDKATARLITVVELENFLLEKARRQKADALDLIILRQSLHTSRDLGKSLKAILELLCPGGQLVLLERYPDWSADVLDGLGEDWWTCTRDGNVVSPRLGPEIWLTLLKEAGFADCQLLREDDSPEREAGAFLICASKPRAGQLPDQPEPAGQSWLLVHDQGGDSLAARLKTEMEALGQKVELASLTAPATSSAENVVFMCGYDTQICELPAVLDRLNRQLLAYAPKAGLLWLLTEGGALFDTGEASRQNPLQAAISGFGRVFANEKAPFAPRLVDISPDLLKNGDLKALLREFLESDGVDEVALTLRGRFVPRIAPELDLAQKNPQRYRLEISNPGRLTNLAWLEQPETAIGEGEIEARVMATGLNFRDVMQAMGLLPEDVLENGLAGATFGLEFSGVVTRVGPNSGDHKPGDRVAGFASSCFASHVRAPATALMPLPPELDYATAASLPTVFMTAWYALKHLAQLQPGERLLVHGGAGGVGLAAIQIAQLLGAEVFVTAGTDEKRDFLRLLGVKNIYDSRKLDFAEEIMADTGQQGVDVVLNSLAGEAMRRSLAILKPFGRFLELGKRDYVENTSLGLRPFKENISYFSIDADQLLKARPALAQKLFAEVMAHLQAGALKPIPVKSFAATEIIEAFRTMQQARHMGKIVVDMSEAPELATRPESHKRDIGDTWLISGGLDGFGLVTARNLARQGAKQLVLASRRGPASPNAAKIEEEFARLGVKVLLKACDFTDQAAVQKLLEEISTQLPPLSGIVHAAAVFDDRKLENLDEASFKRSLLPKIAGAWNLHLASAGLPIKYFVLYSSISVMLGNPGQANYVAANAALESLTRLRNAQNLPATCIEWGPIADAGYLTRNPTVQKSLSHYLGKAPLSSEQAMRAFNRLYASNGLHVVASIDWSRVALQTERPPERFSGLYGAPAKNAEQGGSDFLQLLKNMAPDAALEKLRACVTGEAAKVLGLGPEQLPADSSLQSLGLDSLMAMELAIGLEQETGLRLPPMLLQDAPTISHLAQRLLDRVLAGNNAPTDENSELLKELARRHAEDLAPEEADKVLRDMGHRQQ